ncbi:MAG: hypothetical protein FWE76_00700 [Symbiobacteriaceae bacterium]|nr:hypothetical protein [Symbiobacteriaceae bacterium]
MQARVRSLYLTLLLVSLVLGGCTISLRDPHRESSVLASFRVEPPTVLADGEFISQEAVKALLDHLSLRQKVGQLVLTGFEGAVKPTDLNVFVGAFQVGGLLLYPRNIQNSTQLKELIDYGNDLTHASGLVVKMPLLWCLGEEGGRNQRLPRDLGVFENAQTVGDSAYGVEGALEYGQRLAGALRQVGINALIGPVFDRRGSNPLIGSRAYSDDPVITAVIASAVLQGLHDEGVIGIVQHYPGIGDAVYSSPGEFMYLDTDYTHLVGRELVPFRAAINSCAEMVLVSHLMIPTLDEDYPASLSTVMLNEVLRNTLGYNGIILCDDLNATAITEHYSPGEAAVRAILAGCDMVLVCHNMEDQEDVLNALYQACASGEITEERLEESLGRIISLKQRFLLWP